MDDFAEALERTPLGHQGKHISDMVDEEDGIDVLNSPGDP